MRVKLLRLKDVHQLNIELELNKEKELGVLENMQIFNSIYHPSVR